MAIVRRSRPPHRLGGDQAENPKGLHDPGLYMVLADQVANGHGYSYPGVDGGVTAYYPPATWLLLAALMWGIGLLPGDVPPTSRCGPMCCCRWPRSRWSSPWAAPGQPGGRPGGGGGLRRVAQPVIHSGVILTETLFLFLLVCMFLVALATPEVARRPGWRRLATVGVLFGLAGPVRPVSLVIAAVPAAVVVGRRGLAVRSTAIVGLATRR